MTANWLNFDWNPIGIRPRFGRTPSPARPRSDSGRNPTNRLGDEQERCGKEGYLLFILSICPQTRKYPSLRILNLYIHDVDLVRDSAVHARVWLCIHRPSWCTISHDQPFDRTKWECTMILLPITSLDLSVRMPKHPRALGTCGDDRILTEIRPLSVVPSGARREYHCTCSSKHSNPPKQA